MRISGISSKATQALTAELAAAYQARTGVEVAIESVGGVDAARRVQAGEAFDVVLLAEDALETLAKAGRVVPGSRVGLVRSEVVVAVRAAEAAPDVASVPALQAALRAARAVGISTGPSGVQFAKRVERWGMAAELEGRLVTAPPGVPVGALLARGEVDIGVQQRPELMGLPGVRVLGALPGEAAIVTTFSGAVGAGAAQPEAAAALLRWLASDEVADVKRRHGMAPA